MAQPGTETEPAAPQPAELKTELEAPDVAGIEASLKESPNDTEDTQKTSSDALLCGVCEKNAPKYKCPRCYLPYCSVACNKLHREIHANDPEPTPQTMSTPTGATAAPSQPFDPTNPFSSLEHSPKLQLLFKKYPRLPEQLLRIDSATLPPRVEKPKIPASLLKDLPSSKTQEWDQDKAIASGKAALRDARKADGEDGEAIREYSELVLHLMDDSNRKR